MFVPDSELARLFCERRPWMDVRSPGEFFEGSLPGAVNLPLLDDEERHRVGLCYKLRGQEQAISLGETIVSGRVRAQRMDRWREFLITYPRATIYCFRGGLRSQSVARALRAEHGFDAFLLEGGYKRARQFLRGVLESESTRERFVILSGRTGSGKTLLLQELSARCRVVDLEALAAHRGSAFGRRSTAQPRVADFENRLAVELLIHHRSNRPGPLILEDESRLIGRVSIPSTLFARQQTSPLVVIEESMESRVHHLLHDYLSWDFHLETAEDAKCAVGRLKVELHANLDAIERRLGGARAQVCRTWMDEALHAQEATGSIDGHRPWVEFLLREYYDPAYDHHLKNQSERIVFRGDRKAVQNYLEELR